MVAGRRIRLTAVLVTVVFALTGFSSTGGGSGGSGGKSKSKSSGGGGGCSSSKSSKKKTHAGSGGSTASASPSASPSGDPATAVVVSCVGAGGPVTTLKVTSRLGRKAAFEVGLHRQTASGAEAEATVVKVTLDARETRTVDVALENPARATEVKTCRIGTITVLAAPGSSATGSATPGATPSGSTPSGSTSTSPSKPKSQPTKRRP